MIRIFSYDYRGQMGSLVALQFQRDETNRNERFCSLGHTLALHAASRRPLHVNEFLKQPANNPLEDPKETTVQGRLDQIGQECDDTITIREIISLTASGDPTFCGRVIAS